MQSLLTKIEHKKNLVSIPESLSPKKLIYSSAESNDFIDFIASQHPLINMWLVFSLLSIGILSILLFVL
jgi:hypothetical protein